MRINANTTLLPFYTELDEQKRPSKPLIAPFGLLPFQLAFPFENPITGIGAWEVMDINGNQIIPNMRTAENNLDFYYGQNVGSWLVYQGRLQLGAFDEGFDEGFEIGEGQITGDGLCGLYYYRIMLHGYGYVYSEVFYVPREVYNLNAIEYGNKCDMLNTLYDIGYKNIYYHEGSWSENSPEILEEGEENGEGEEIITNRVYLNNYSFSEVEDETSIEGLSKIQLHDTITIHNGSGVLIVPENANVKSLTTSTSWLEDGDMGIVTFNAQTVRLQVGSCCNNINLIKIPF